MEAQRPAAAAALHRMAGSITSEPFDSTPDMAQRSNGNYRLRNRHGMGFENHTYCGILTSLTAPDRNGHCRRGMTCQDTPLRYLKSSPVQRLISRYGNRIHPREIPLDGIEYTLATNNELNNPHSSNVGSWKEPSRLEILSEGHSWGPQLTLKYLSRDGRKLIPAIRRQAIYTLTEDNALPQYATTDKNTVLNLTPAFLISIYADLENILRPHCCRSTLICSQP